MVRVSVVATGIDNLGATRQTQPASSLTELTGSLRKDSHRSAERIERSAPQPQLSGDPPAFFRMTEEALLRLEKGLPVPSASNQRSHQPPKPEGATEGDRHRHRVARRQLVRAPWQ